MMPNLIDENSFLLRDYTSLIQNLTEKMPTLTDKWTDFTISEPDTIFLNNIAYINDLTSYAIDYRYLVTSVRYTFSRDFMNSLCILTGSSAPFYRETCSVIIESHENQARYIPRNSVLYDSAHRYALTTLEDTFLLPQSVSTVSVIEGNAYNQSLGRNRSFLVKATEPINRDTFFSLDGGGLLDRQFSSAETMFGFLLDGKERYWISQGDGSSLVFSPSLPYLPYRFVGFSIEKENVLADNATITYPGFNGSMTLSKRTEGTKPRSINDWKVAYLESLHEIQTDANPLLYEERYRRGSYSDISRTSLLFSNSRSSVLSRSFVDHVQGYIDISGSFYAGDKVTVTYECYPNSEGPSVLTTRSVEHEFTAKVTHSYTINLELEEGYTVKAYSIFAVFRLIDGTELYCTDYDNTLILPRGREIYKDYRYLLKDSRSCTDLDFCFGVCHTGIAELHVADRAGVYDRTSVSYDGEMTRFLSETFGVDEYFKAYSKTGTIYETVSPASPGSYYLAIMSLLIPVQEPMSVRIQDKIYALEPSSETPIYLYGIDRRETLKIQAEDGSPLFRVVFGNSGRQSGTCFVTLDEGIIQHTDSMPSCVYHDRRGIYFIPSPSLDISGTVSVTLDGICTYQHNLSQARRMSMNGYPDFLLIPYRQEYIERFCPDGESYPSEVCVQVGDRRYYSERNRNASQKNFYNSLLSSDLARQDIDLYQIPSRYSQVTEVPVSIKATVYLIPLDLDKSFIEKQIMDSLREFFSDLAIGMTVRTAGILSRIVHASDYVAYAELDTPRYDIEISETQLAVLGKVSLIFRDPDLIQY